MFVYIQHIFFNLRLNFSCYFSLNTITKAMDQSYSESDVSLSPSQILDRLHVLRQLQLLQRGKLQKQRLEYQETTETSSSITEIVSHFSNSTSYNTFRSLLQSSHETSNEVTPRLNASNVSHSVNERDLLEGVAALNLSQESEFIVNSPLSSQSRVSVSTGNENLSPLNNNNTDIKSPAKKQISLDEMPILTPKKDFETLLLEKLKNEKHSDRKEMPKEDGHHAGQTKKPFLKRGEGMARFGVNKTDLIIQSTKALPWKRKSLETRVTHPPKKNKNSEKDVQIEVNNEPKLQLTRKTEIDKRALYNKNNNKTSVEQEKNVSDEIKNNKEIQLENNIATRPIPKIQLPKGKHPLSLNKGKTWAAVLTKEQDDFLRELKQSEYYKNFTSPAKSTVSDASCNEQIYNIRQEREAAEQHMFELLENKVTNESFSMESSFLNKFLRKSMECSGDSTPLVMQKCLANNPKLFHIFPNLNQKNSECSCEYTDCSDTCSVSSCSTCKTVEENCTETPKELSKKYAKKKDSTNKLTKKEAENQEKKEACHNDIVTVNNEMQANMAEMNAKLIATSELLKDRLRELEDEIETFRKENNNLAKLREEVDLERQKFYEEKNTFEQKFNEDKILSEYYLAEEKEKLTKQKHMYERYVREIRGRLNKKDKDEVINLKKEVSDLKEEIRHKDAKSTSTIARLRNQLKIMEKEKNNLQSEVEKLKKENRRIMHSNDITRRLTNVKYLEEINKKLTNMTKNTQSEVDIDNDVKYKAHEIERQSRSRRVKTQLKETVRPRAKSVPNLNVTSRYAKYFSQRDALSHLEGNESLYSERFNRYVSDDKINDDDKIMLGDVDVESIEESDEQFEEDNNLEKLYMERFQNSSPASNRSSLSNTDRPSFKENPDAYFIQKSVKSASKTSNQISPLNLNINSYSNRSKSPVSIFSQRSGTKSPLQASEPNNFTESSTSKSPVSILSNRSSSSQKSATVIDQMHYRERLLNVSPELSASKTSLAKTNMNPTEIKKPDGSKELRFPNGNIKYISADGKYSKFIYYNGDIKENFYSEGRIKYYYAEPKTYHTTHADGLEVLEFPDGQVEKRYKDGSSEIRLPNGSVRYQDPKNSLVREEWRFPDGTALTVSAAGEKRVVFSNGQVEVHAADHKRREYPDGTVKLVYADGTAETRYASGRVRVKDRQGNLVMDSAPG